MSCGDNWVSRSRRWRWCSAFLGRPADRTHLTGDRPVVSAGGLIGIAIEAILAGVGIVLA